MSNKTGRHRTRRLPPEGDPRRYLFVEAWRCTHCQGTSLHIYAVRRNEDNEQVRHAECRACGGRFIIVSA